MSQLGEEVFGLAGGALFLLSWLLQAWESRRAGSPVVSRRFFGLRIVGCSLLIVEAVRNDSISLFVVAAGTLVLNLYNIWLFRRSGLDRTTG